MRTYLSWYDPRNVSPGGEGTPFHPEMRCFVRRIAYDFNSKVGAVEMEEMSCTDMSGAIRVFTRIDPDVAQIQTFAGNRLDTVYTDVEGQWRASAPKRGAR